SRVRRATENASRAALSRIEPVRSTHQNQAPSLSIDKEATARALEITIDVSSKPESSIPPIPIVRTHPQAMPRELPALPDLSPVVDSPDLSELSGSIEQPETLAVEPVRTPESGPAPRRILI